MNGSIRRFGRPRAWARRCPPARHLAVACVVLGLGAGVNPSPAADVIGREAEPVATSHVAREDSTVQQFEVGGVTVIHRERPGDGLLAVDLYLLGGVRLATEETAGIEPLLLEASGRGTQNFPGLAALRAEVATGSRIVISAEPDWTLFGFRGISDEFESTWAVFADRVMHPELDSAGVSIARERMLTSRRAGSDDPEALATGMAARAAFEGHPYALAANGTEASLAAITADELRAYHAANTVSSRMLLVIVGDVSRERIEAVVSETLGRLPAGDYTWTLPATWTAEDATVAARARAIPTNYIVGYFGGPRASSEDYPAFQIALALTSSLVFQVARAEGLSYTAGAYAIERAATGGVIHVATRYPARSIEIVNDVIELFKWGVLPKSMIRDYAKGWITGYWLANETNGQQAAFLARGYLFNDRLRTPEDYVEELRNVAPDAVRRVTNRYMKNMQYAFVGDTTLVPRSEMGKH